MSITRERAIEILDPEHRECYGDLQDGYEQVDEACRMGMEALIRERDGGDVRHGHWIISSDGYYPCCSRCNTEPKGGLSHYCPECGAKMDEEVDQA